MKKTLLSSMAVAVLAAAVAFPALAQNLAVVNGKAIPQERFTAFKEQLEKAGRPITPELEKQIKEEIITREVLEQEAARQKLNMTREFREQQALANQGLLINALIETYTKSHPVTDAEIKAEYDKFVAENKEQKEYKVSHILVEEEGDADKILARLKKGEKFEDIAQKESKDPGSGEKGGDLGWADPSRYVPEFSEAMVKLEKGKTTDKAVKSQFGWHIIRLDDVRDVTLPTQEELKPRIESVLQAKKQQAYIQELRDKAKVE